MRERLEAILKYEKLTPSRLADILGVQRSGISHIMSGRNKPGLDFLAKLISNFPHINGDWLITGEGPMLKNGSNKPSGGQMSIPMTSMPSEVKKEPEKPNIKMEKPAGYTSMPKIAQPTFEKNKATQEKDIERIIVFYTDKSFTEYKPE
ncbi:helix-turn-helix domain-containing protein [Carboxylicivirga caseinilyticus]|uniref:helix-turn-helix domain-containing protein n=1 Tax=Carboxylicivirga caseinilyticus TaxID=3417572 RepID=UPI003D345DB6|nr:helix-turn-helix transcriptional regulator [Marinilabiliaceae bacterium A049]